MSDIYLLWPQRLIHKISALNKIKDYWLEITSDIYCKLIHINFPILHQPHSSYFYLVELYPQAMDLFWYIIVNFIWSTIPEVSVNWHLQQTSIVMQNLYYYLILHMIHPSNVPFGFSIMSPIYHLWKQWSIHTFFTIKRFGYL